MSDNVLDYHGRNVDFTNQHALSLVWLRFDLSETDLFRSILMQYITNDVVLIKYLTTLFQLTIVSWFCNLILLEMQKTRAFFLEIKSQTIRSIVKNIKHRWL